MPASDLSPAPHPRFISLDLEITNLCSNSCLMCPRDAITRARGMMEPYTFEGLMSFLASSRCLVTFSGMGDPLRHPRFPEFVRHASEAGHETGVVLHPASLVHEVGGVSGMKRLLVHPPDSITISFPSVRPAVFERLFPGTGLGDAVKLVLELKQHLPRKVRVSGMISGLNDDEEEEYRAFWKKLQVPCWMTRCHGRGGNLKVPGLLSEDARQGIGERGICSLFLFHSFVTWQGEFLSCCHDLSGETFLGNVSRLSRYTDLVALKQKFAVQTPCPPFELCRKCDEPLRSLNLRKLPEEGKPHERRRFFSRLAGEAGRRAR